MSSNGHDEHRAMVERAMSQIATPRTVAQLSSSERSQLLDQMVAQLRDIVGAHNRLGQVVEAQGLQITALTNGATEAAQCCQDRWDAQSETNKRIGDRQQAFVARSFMARFLWLVTGR